MSPWKSYQQANPAFHLSEVGKWVPVNTDANSWVIDDEDCSSDRRWLYDRRLSTYDPGSVGGSRVDLFSGTSIQVCTVSFYERISKYLQNACLLAWCCIYFSNGILWGSYCRLFVPDKSIYQDFCFDKCNFKSHSLSLINQCFLSLDL